MIRKRLVMARSIESEDIDAAIAAGVMPQAQADALRAFVAERHRSRLEQAGTEDERFRFMTGFNDFFFAIGILLLGFGMMFFTGGVPLPSLIAAAADLGACPNCWCAACAWCCPAFCCRCSSSCSSFSRCRPISRR